ncbi:MAG: deoxyhypusine synthase [Candidatus Odinarchaeia archaeon]
MKHKNFVKGMRIKENMNAAELIKEFEGAGAFGAGRIAKAVHIIKTMFENRDVLKFLGLAGALVPAGIRRIIADMIYEGYIDVIVTTGANLTHDLIEAFGGKHEKMRELLDDVSLHKQGINRIFDIYVRNESFELLEDKLQQIFTGLPKEIRTKGLAVYELMHEIGRNVNDRNSIVRAAYEKNVPIFCPAITDSILGLQIWLFNQTDKLNLNLIKDLQKIIDIAYEAKSAGTIILGGGVPKNHILQTMLITGRGFDYAVQITTDRPEPGGLSGASLQEAQSWGKVKPNAMWVDVIGDATIIFPLIIAAVKCKINIS